MDFPGFQVHARLKERNKFAGLEAKRNLLFKIGAFEHLVAHLNVVTDHAIATTGLCSIHRNIGVAKEFLRGQACS